MRRQLRRKGNIVAQHRPRYPDDLWSYKSRGREVRPAGKVIHVHTYLPRSVARRVRREIYPYRHPHQVRKRGRTIRVPLIRRPDMVKTKVKIRLPRLLPLVQGSYVELSNGQLKIHSRKQLRRLEHAQEFNRRRYSEHKGNHRKGRYGQLDSRGSGRFGSVAEAYWRGGSIDQIADAALVARAIR